jgi:uncharacterized protein YkwD
LAAASGAGARPAVSSLDRAVLAQINKFRVAHGRHALRLSSRLTAAAAQHSHEMVSKGYFSHNSANGASPFTRIKRYYPSAGFRHWLVGENLLYGSPSISPAAALNAWVHSPEHLRNILDPSWREIGVSAVHSGSAPGYYGHRPTTVITTDFGVRR